MSNNPVNRTAEQPRLGFLNPPRAASGFTFIYKGFPVFRKRFDPLSFHLLFSGSFSSALPGACEKVKDGRSTNGHVGLMARTLMKDARGGLIR